MPEVQRLLHLHHKDHYKVYNLCIERTYKKIAFEQEYHEVRFPDHNPCPLQKLQVICNDLQDFMAEHPLNTVAIHCKAGKGRTGMIIAALLLHTGTYESAVAALDAFGSRRTYNGKGVTIPSQIRYVYHYETIIREKGFRPPCWLRLKTVEVLGVEPDPEDWYVTLFSHDEGKIFDSKVADRQKPPIFEGDIKVALWCDKADWEGRLKLFQFWLHTAYDPAPFLLHPDNSEVEGIDGYMVWEAEDDSSPIRAGSRSGSHHYLLEHQRRALDGPHKSKDLKVPADMKIRLTFDSPTEEEANEEHLERARRLVQRERDHSYIKRHTHHKASHPHVMDDYDDLDQDTDLEEITSAVYRGYLRRSGGCSKPQHRWCEIHKSGALTITGKGALMFDLTRCTEANFDRFEGPEGKISWRIRSERSHAWETLEAGEPAATKDWDQALDDAIKLGACQRTFQPFGGFFWKLNAEFSEDDVKLSFEMVHWRIRLFVVKDDGRMYVHSRKDNQENVFSDLSEPGPFPIQKVEWTWRGMKSTVPFKIPSTKGQRILVASLEDYKAFVASVQRVRAALHAVPRASDTP